MIFLVLLLDNSATSRPYEDPSASVLQELQSLAVQASHLIESGRFAEAIPVATKVVDLTSSAFGPEDPVVALWIAQLANLQLHTGNHTAAQSGYDRAIEIIEKSQGSSSPDLALPLNGLGMLEIFQGKYSKAISTLEQSLKLREGQPENLLLAQILNNLGEANRRKGDHRAARAYFKRAFKVMDNIALPAVRSVQATCMNNLGLLHLQTGDFINAEKMFNQSLDLRRKLYGDDHPETARTLNNLGELYRGMGKYPDASRFYEAALKIQSERLGQRHVEVAGTRGNLGLLYHQQGNFSKAREEYLQALQIRRSALSPDHPDTITSLLNMGRLYADLGQYEESEKLLDEALSAAKRNRDVYPELLSLCWNNRGMLFLEKGEFAAARSSFEEALQNAAKSLGPDSISAGESISNLARVSALQYDFETSRKYQDQAFTILSKSLGEHHPEIALQLHNMGVLMLETRKFERAETYLNRALEIRKKTLGERHPGIASTLNALGSVRISLNNLPAAESDLAQAARLREELLGAAHPGVAVSWNNLASVYLMRGETEKSMSMFQKVLDLNQQVLGPYHPRVANSHGNLGLATWLQGDRQVAREQFLKAAGIYARNNERVLPTLSFAEQRSYLEHQSFLTGLMLSTCSTDPCFPSAYELLFRTKGLLVEFLRSQSVITRHWKTPYLEKKRDRLRQVRSDLSGWFHSAGTMDAVRWQKRLDELTTEKEKLEREWMSVSGQVIRDPLASLDLRSFQSLLKDDEALVDVYQYRAYFQKPDQIEDRYGAVILFPAGEPTFFDLGSKFDIHRLIRIWSSEVRDGEDAVDAWQDLKTAVWGPLSGVLRERASRIWVSPDSELARVPWHLFPDPAGNGHKTLVSQIDSPRMLAILRSAGNSDSTPPSMLLAGNIDFNSGSGNRSTVSFPPLPGTETEIRTLEELAGTHQIVVRRLSESQADKNRVIQELSDAKFGHIATHGFFYQDMDPAADSGYFSALWAEDEGRCRSCNLRNPLVESGIALAGANIRDPSDFRAEGLLTAEELVSLDLSRCVLLALSACETGRGQESTGQGVLGLRASVLSAGARSVLISLWKVPDESTVHLMKAFYSNLWIQKMPKAEALIAAQKTVRDHPSGAFQSPLYWAAWVLAGEGW